MILLWAALAMAAKDALRVIYTAAVARGRPVLAGFADAAEDLAQIGVVVCGAGRVLEHGLDGKSLEVLAVIVVTSFIGTLIWTTLSRRIVS